MKKSLIIIIGVMLVVLAIAGCSQSEAATPEATPTPTPTAEPSATPEATPTPTPEPIKAILQTVTETTEYEIPEVYETVMFEEDVAGVDEITYTIYAFMDKNDEKHYRAYGFRTDPKTNEKYDEGIYSIEVTEAEKDGEKSVTVVFDAINAMPVDLTQEKDLYAEKKDTKKNTDTKATEKPKTDSKTTTDKVKDTPKNEDVAPVKTTEPEAPATAPAPAFTPKPEAPAATPAPPAPTPEPTAPDPTPIPQEPFDDGGKLPPIQPPPDDFGSW